jgi:hypothetical protein
MSDVLADRWYVFEPSGAQLATQPRRGFRSARQAWEWLRWGEFDLRGLTVTLGAEVLRNATTPVVAVPVEGEGDERQHQDQEQQRVDRQPAEDSEQHQDKGQE